MRLFARIAPRPGFAFPRAETPRRRQSGHSRHAAIALGLGLTTALLTAVAPAHAADRTFDFRLPSQRVSEALLELAIQARTPLGGDLSACRGRSPGVRGVMTLRTALDRLLEGSGCAYVLRPDQSIIIRRAPAPRRPASPPPAPVEPALSPTADDAAQLSDIIVTAERRPESPQTAPTALTSLSSERIAAAGAVDANDLSTLVAGMAVTNLGSGRNKILLRGMSDGAFTGLTQSTVGIYLNRSPLTFNAPDPDLKLIDLDRVEVLRGPQGALYGAGAIGGILRIVPEAPDPLHERLEIFASRSATHGGGQNSDYSLVANVPLPGRRGAVRGVVYAEEFGGYINDVSLNLRRVNDGARHGGRVSAAYHLAHDWSVEAGGTWQRIKTEDTHYVYRTLGGLRRANLVREPHANDFSEMHVTLEGHGDWGRVTATVSNVDHNFDSRYDASVALRAFGSNGRIGALDESRRIDLSVAEVVFNAPERGPFRWLAGVFASTGETQSDTALWTLWPYRGVTYAEDRRDERQKVAVFGEASYALSPELGLLIGGRYYRINLRTRSRVTQGPASRLFEGQTVDTGFSPRLGLDYRPDSRWSYYVQIAQGHRTGGFNTSGPIGQMFIGAVGEPGRFYDGDTLWNYELGAKGRLWGGRVQTRIALFRAYWNDIQSDQFLPSGLAYAVNVGDGANTGLEIETNWRPTPDLEIRANTLLSDPEITRPSDRFNSRGDAGLPGVPAVSANVTVAWRREVVSGLEVFSDVTLAYVGASRLTFDAARRYRMGDYVTGRLAAGLSADPWRLTVFADNPFDTTANTFSFGDPFRLPEALATTPLRPRTVGVSLSFRH